MKFENTPNEFQLWYSRWQKHDDYATELYRSGDSVYHIVSKHGTERDMHYLVQRLNNINDAEYSRKFIPDIIKAIRGIASRSDDEAKVLSVLTAYYL